MSYTEDDLRITITGELYMGTCGGAMFPVCSGVVVPGVSPENHPPYITQVQTASYTSTYLYQWSTDDNMYAKACLTTPVVNYTPTVIWDASTDSSRWEAVPRADPVTQPVPSGFSNWFRSQDPASRPQVPVSLSDTEVNWEVKQNGLYRWWRETKKELETRTTVLDIGDLVVE
jgi:hypothetical protein